MDFPVIFMELLIYQYLPLIYHMFTFSYDNNYYQLGLPNIIFDKKEGFMSLKIVFLLCFAFVISTGLAFTQTGVGLEPGIYVSSSGRGRNVEHYDIGIRTSDGLNSVTYYKARSNDVPDWEGRGKADPSNNRFFGIFLNNNNIPTYNLEILSNDSFKFQGVEFRLFSRDGSPGSR